MHRCGVTTRECTHRRYEALGNIIDVLQNKRHRKSQHGLRNNHRVESRVKPSENVMRWSIGGFRDKREPTEQYLKKARLNILPMN